MFIYFINKESFVKVLSFFGRNFVIFYFPLHNALTVTSTGKHVNVFNVLLMASLFDLTKIKWISRF
jgi:hypothetical protein